MWTLQAVDPENARLMFRMLPGTLKTVGRAPRADFVIDVPMVSRVHCRLMVTASNELELEDMGSTNGTFVNGEKITKATLNDGDKVTIGRVEFVVNSGADRQSEQKTAWRAD
ncbi:MAG TPA: FHA domain-containing protein [Vicinamibacterales bacterium]|nr:FHA domain-containing protein [Vicinamibacterales bacterium]